MKFNKRILGGGIAFTWTALPAYEVAMGIVSTDIINGVCKPWSAYPSYTMEKTFSAITFLLVYLMPLMLMVYCYSRVIIKLRTKVLHQDRL